MVTLFLMTRRFFLATLMLIAALTRVDSAHADDAPDWIYLDNGQIRIGVKKSSGACIGFLSAGVAGRNLLDHADQGRFVQQSYYGDEDGSLWAAQKWRYNPVQGGEYKGQASELKEFRADEKEIYAKITPRNWAGGELLPEVTMEEWIRLEGSLARVRFKMTYAGEKTHAARHQEIPAIFTEPSLKTLVAYAGDKPWTNDVLSRKTPGWPNEGQKMSENWVAYVDDAGQGIGAYVPIATDATCYRYLDGGATNCSYVAPIINFALKPNLVFEYEIALTIGNTEQMRARFFALHQQNAVAK
jgi:hypothetical protein